jgi:D-alanyl-D-alanine carboxypeptidase/D-alanyl-D-alanine-endopeptidase (penicillin-binding protein 4)
MLSIAISSCSTAYNVNKRLKQDQQKNSYFDGFVLYNPKTKKELINHNGAKYFTPASNTKLFTFYTAYKTLKDSIKSLAYYKTTDSLIIKGTASPTFLNGIEGEKVLDFLKNTKESIYILDAAIDESVYGSGWAWDDYSYYYMPEKSLYPMYGNVLKYNLSDGMLQSTPHYFKTQIIQLDSVLVSRQRKENLFYVQKNNQEEYEVPFITSNRLVADLLSDKLRKTVTLIPNKKDLNFKYIYNQNIDSIYKQMLTVSDNFIAEQLLLQVGKEVADNYSVSAAIKYSLENYLQDLPQKPRWVDGSGLSRYNLFTPESLVKLLEKMYVEIPTQKLLNYFPVGGISGTLKKSYIINDKPYIYAKTGTLSNNHCLSGYIITKKGTFLIFSYMNNHYRVSSKEVKATMEKTLLQIYNTY